MGWSTHLSLFSCWDMTRNFVLVRTSPMLSTFSYANESLMHVCQSFMTSEPVVRAIIYSTEGFAKRTQIKRDMEQIMGNRTCGYTVLTCGLILCLAGCCFPCYQKMNPQLDEMSLSQKVQEQSDNKKHNSHDEHTDTYTFTAVDSITAMKVK